MIRPPALLLTALLAIAVTASSNVVTAEPPPEVSAFEDLGVAVKHRPVHNHQYLFVDQDGREISWGDKFAGFYLDTGEPAGPSLERLKEQYGRSALHMTTLGADGKIYLYYGKPSHFFRYDPYRGTLTDLGVPDEKAFYYLDNCPLSDDGVYYVGTYPRASLVSCNTRTGAVKFEAVLTQDARQHYVLTTEVNAEGLVFAFVGLHHSELAAYNPNSGELKQLLPEAWQSTREHVHLVRAADGQVYGHIADHRFICRFDSIEEVREIPPAMKCERGPDKLANGHRASVELNDDGCLVVHDLEADAKRQVRVHINGEESEVYCLGAELDDRIFGGSMQPASVFYYDRSQKEFVDYGLSLGTQTYAVCKVGDGLFFTTYTEGKIFYLDPRLPIKDGTNPKRVAKLVDEHQQERLLALVPAPDGNLYIPSVPVKGHLGGALTRFNPTTLDYRVYRGIIPNQSVMSLTPVPETGEIFGTSDIRGGTSAHPSEQEAFIFLWNPVSEQVVYKSRPVPGATGYHESVRGGNGVIYCHAGSTIVGFDPVKRKVVATTPSPVEVSNLVAEPAAVEKKVYGIGRGAILTIDPVDHSCRVLAHHDSLRHEISHGIFIDSGSNLYYGVDAHVWRCRLWLLE